MLGLILQDFFKFERNAAPDSDKPNNLAKLWYFQIRKFLRRTLRILLKNVNIGE